MNGWMPMFRWNEYPFRPTPGGLLDGLPEPRGGSGLELLMSPEEISGIAGLGTGSRGEHPGQDSEPRLLEARDNSPHTEPQNPSDKAEAGVGDVAGKIWNLPNTAIGLGYGTAGYLTGWPSYWLGLQDEPPGITTGNNAVQFTNNPFGGVGAITIGNTETFAPDTDKDNRKALGPHEEQHTYQGQQLGPFYLPSNILGGASGLLIDGEWRGRHNWNEAGPYQNPPRPWPK